MIARRYPALMQQPPGSGGAVERWAASGAMALTGLPDQPLGPPAGLVEGMERLGARFTGLDALALLGERAAHMALWRRGAVSCGGSCRLLPCADGWIAVSLPRAEDMELVPAWRELETNGGTGMLTPPATWEAVGRTLAGCSAAEVSGLLRRARLLGLPVAAVGEAQGAGETEADDGDGPLAPGVVRTVLGDALARPVNGLRIVDLSALWAGPLCGDLLAGVGADVMKVESWARPDGARRGPAPFFDLLNGRKRSVALDLRSKEEQGVLLRLIRQSDVVIEASRPRALAQMGMDACRLLTAAAEGAGPQIWISITGFGRTHDDGQRVAFGDDAAAAAGLVVWHEDLSGSTGRATPLFCADAVADPLTGLAAAGACLDALERGERCLLDVSMAGVCASLAGPTLTAGPDVVVADPRARQSAGRAPALGADTDAVLAELSARER